MVGTTIYDGVNQWWEQPIYNDVDQWWEQPYIHGERWLSSRTRACRTWFSPDGPMDGWMERW